MGRPAITNPKERKWYRSLQYKNGHLLYVGEQKVDKWRAPYATVKGTSINMRREVYRESPDTTEELGPDDRLIPNCEYSNCCEATHMDVVSSSFATKARLHEAKRRVEEEQKPWLKSYKINGNSESDFSDEGKAAFRFMKYTMLYLFGEGDRDDGFLDRERMERNADDPVGVILDVMELPVGKIRAAVFAPWRWEGEEFEACLIGVLTEPLFKQHMRDGGIDDFNLPRQIMERAGMPYLHLGDGEGNLWQVCLDPRLVEAYDEGEDDDPL